MRGLAVGVALAIAGLATAGVATASPCPDRIAFAGSWEDANGGHGGMFTMNEDGSDVQEVVSGVAGSPAVSPDRTQLVFGGTGLQIVGFGGGGLSWLDQDGGISDPGYHPNGTQVAYGKVDGQVWWGSYQNPYFYDVDTNIYRLDVDSSTGTGSNRTRIIDWPHAQSSPDYNADGSKVVFTSNGSPEGADYIDRSRTVWFEQWALFIANADGSSPQQLTSLSDFAYAVGPKFSPDGTKVAFTGKHLYNELEGVWVLDLATGGTTRLADGQNPEWAPDGQSIVFDDFTTLARISPSGGTAAEIPIGVAHPIEVTLSHAAVPTYRKSSALVTYTPGDCGSTPPPEPPPTALTQGNAESSTSTGTPSSTASTSSSTYANAKLALQTNKGGPKGDPLYRPPKQ